jgi:hypothetical protein
VDPSEPRTLRPDEAIAHRAASPALAATHEAGPSLLHANALLAAATPATAPAVAAASATFVPEPLDIAWAATEAQQQQQQQQQEEEEKEAARQGPQQQEQGLAHEGDEVLSQQQLVEAAALALAGCTAAASSAAAEAPAAAAAADGLQPALAEAATLPVAMASAAALPSALAEHLQRLTSEVSRLSQRVAELEATAGSRWAAPVREGAALQHLKDTEHGPKDEWEAPAGPATAGTPGSAARQPAGEVVEAAWAPLVEAPPPAYGPCSLSAASHVILGGRLLPLHRDDDGAPVVLSPRRIPLGEHLAGGGAGGSGEGAPRPLLLPADAYELLDAAAAGQLPGVFACAASTAAATRGRAGQAAHGEAPMTVAGAADEGACANEALVKYAVFDGALVPVFDSPMGHFVSVPAAGWSEAEPCSGRIEARVQWLERLMHVPFFAVYLRVDAAAYDAAAAAAAAAAAEEARAAAAAAAAAAVGEAPAPTVAEARAAAAGGAVSVEEAAAALVATAREAVAAAREAVASAAPRAAAAGAGTRVLQCQVVLPLWLTAPEAGCMG